MLSHATTRSVPTAWRQEVIVPDPFAAQDQWVDLGFAIRGAELPLDHGYPLFGAISRVVPRLHAEPSWGLHPVLGERRGAGVLAVTPRSRLRFRIPVGAISEFLPLVGLDLDVAGLAIAVGVPEIRPLVPAARLKARLVIIKGFAEDEGRFEEAVRRQLSLVPGSEGIVVRVGARRVARVSNHTVVGFQVELDGVPAECAIPIQQGGLGGRRHMGAGIFVPAGRIKS
jgi:CRISPR-associated protein Cas6